MKRFSGVLVFALLAACAAKPLEPAVPGDREVVLSEGAAPAGYVQVRTLAVQSGRGCGVLGTSGSRDDADGQLRREAAKLGASFVKITDVEAPRPNHQCLEHEYKLRGVAYRKASPAPATSAR